MESNIKFICDRMSIDILDPEHWEYEFRFKVLGSYEVGPSHKEYFYVKTDRQLYKIGQEYELMEVPSV